MPRFCSIALAGLSPTERVLIEGALFPPSGSPIPGAYLERDLAQAQLIIASADDLAALAALKVRALPGRVLLLGSSDRGTGWPVVLRPLRIHGLLEAIRRLLDPNRGAVDREVEPKAEAAERGWPGKFAAATSGFADTQPFMDQDLPDAQDWLATRQLETAHPAPRGRDDEFQVTQQFSHSVPSVAPSDWEAEIAEWEQIQAARAAGAVQEALLQSSRPATPAQPEPPVPGNGADPSPATAPVAAGDRILVVGLPGNAPSGLVGILQQAGFAVDFAAGAQAAFDLMGQRPFQFVILIEVSLGPQAISLCRTLQGARGLSPADLKVVIVASHRGLLARLRAQFAGCNAWLTIPLKQAALIQYLRLNGSGNARRA